MGRKSHERPYFANGNALTPKARKDLITDWDECSDLVKKCSGSTVSFFGSAREETGTLLYNFSERLAYVLGKHGLAIITGGGPGFMEGANSGAKSAGAESLAIRSHDLLQHGKEKSPSHLHDRSYDAKHFVLRQFWLQNPSIAHIYFPGGFGTDSERGWSLVQGQTRLAQEIPLLFIEEERNKIWTKYRELVKECMLPWEYISPEDMNLLRHIFTLRQGNFDETLHEAVGIVLAMRRNVRNILHPKNK